MSGSRLEELKGQLAGLQKVRRSGHASISHEGNGVSRSVSYKRDSEMQAAEADIKREIAALEGRPRFIVFRPSASRGW